MLEYGCRIYFVAVVLFIAARLHLWLDNINIVIFIYFKFTI